jgi:hypothetical protein
MSPISPPRNLIKRTPQELEKLAWPDYPRRLDNLCCTWGGQYSDGFGPSVVGLGPEERVERNTFAGITVGRMGVVEEIVEVEGVERKGSKERGRKKGIIMWKNSRDFYGGMEAGTKIELAMVMLRHQNPTLAAQHDKSRRKVVSKV